MFNSTFSSSMVERSGGVIHVVNSSVVVKISSYTYNNARDKGGVLYAQYVSLTVVCSSFIENAASNSGGALLLVNEKHSVSIVVNSMFQITGQNIMEELSQPL